MKNEARLGLGIGVDKKSFLLVKKKQQDQGILCGQDEAEPISTQQIIQPEPDTAIATQNQVTESLKEKDLTKNPKNEAPKNKRVEEFSQITSNFKRIIRKSIAVRIAKAIMLGLALALPVFGVLLLLSRFELASFDKITAGAISLGVLLIIAIITLIASRQSKKAIAMRLDKEHRLDEKVQTMLAFKDQDSPMMHLQRQDADMAIASVKGRAIGVKQIWIYILCLIIGVGLCAVSFFFNPLPNKEPDPIPETPFKVTELQLTALNDLIESVRQSEMQEPYKTDVVKSLTTLYDEIQEVTTTTQKNVIVQRAMNEIYIKTDESSVAVELMNALWSTNAETSRLLAKALNYYEWQGSDEWQSFVDQISDFREGFVHPDVTKENPDEQKITEDTKNVLLSVNTSITNSLTSLNISSSDALYIALSRLASANENNADGTRVYGMKVLAEYIAQNGYARTQRELDATVTALSADLYKALSQNKTNTDTGENAITKISSIFDVQAPELKRPSLYDSSSDSSNDGEGGGADGGISGGPSYGSDDKVYDPFTNKYVEYGAILDKYYSIMFNRLQDGGYTDEEKKALEEYFKILYGGFEEGKDNE